MDLQGVNNTTLDRNVFTKIGSNIMSLVSTREQYEECYLVFYKVGFENVLHIIIP